MITGNNNSHEKNCTKNRFSLDFIVKPGWSCQGQRAKA
jgi:ribosomal protein L28